MVIIAGLHLNEPTDVVYKSKGVWLLLYPWQQLVPQIKNIKIISIA